MMTKQFRFKRFGILPLVVSVSLAMATFEANAGATFKIGDEGSLSLGAGIRTSVSNVENAAPTGTSDATNFRVESAQLYVGGAINKQFKATFATDINSSDSVSVMDAYVQFEPMPAFNVWMGRMLPASDRANLAGPYNLNVWDYPFVSNYPALAFGRDNGIQVWGKMMADKLTYVAGAFKGHNRFLGASNESAKLLYTGRLAFAFWEVEPPPAYYVGGTYYGAKDILTVGLAGMSQKDGVGISTAKANYSAWNIDVLMEKKMAGGGALTLEGAHYKYNLSNVLDCGSTEPGAPACPAAATGLDNVGGQVQGQANLATIAYLFPGVVGWGKFQPFLRHQKLERDLSQTSKSQIDLGVNYLIKGGAKITAAFSRTKDNQIAAPGDSIDKVLLGVQMTF